MLYLIAVTIATIIWLAVYVPSHSWIVKKVKYMRKCVGEDVLMAYYIFVYAMVPTWAIVVSFLITGIWGW